MAAPFAKFRPSVSMPGLLDTVRKSFEGLEDNRRQASCRYSLPDTLMSALAMFSLKYPSLLAFDQDAHEIELNVRHNLGTLYGVKEAPSDTQMRAILDPVDPHALRSAFRAIHSGLQRGGSLKHFSFLGDKLLVAIDGTGHFASTAVHCEHCCEKKPKKKRGAEPEPDARHYFHQLLAAAIVHPEKATVLPIDFEPIVRADGAAKNDSERSAAKRLIASLARQYPARQMVVTEDALSANEPHVSTLAEHGIDFIVVAKPGSVPTLFDTLDERFRAGEAEEWEEERDVSGTKASSIVQGYRVIRDVAIGKEHPDVRVNSIEWWEVTTINGVEHERNGHWITSLPVTRETAPDIARAGRARWKIENELFNVLKNQGYSFEHNYGHGKQYLSSTLGGLTLLAFLIDQVQESFCRVFLGVREACVSRVRMWRRMSAAFTMVRVSDWGVFMAYWERPNSARHLLLVPDG